MLLGMCCLVIRENMLLFFLFLFFFSSNRDIPGGPMVKNPPCSSGDSGSVPGRGTKIPYATGQLSQPAPTAEPESCNKTSRVMQMRLDAAK